MSNDNEELPYESDFSSEFLVRRPYDREQEGWPYIPPNFKYWAAAPFLTDLELACVSLGFDPGPLKVSNKDELYFEPEMLAEILDRLGLIQKAISIGDIRRKIRPNIGSNWLEFIGQEVHPQFRESIEKSARIENAEYHFCNDEEISKIVGIAGSLQKSGVGRTATENKTAIKKKYQSLQKIAVASVIKGYGADLSKKRCEEFGEISNDARALGMTIHTDTVRSLIREAENDQLPSDWKKD